MWPVAAVAGSDSRPQTPSPPTEFQALLPGPGLTGIAVSAEQRLITHQVGVRTDDMEAGGLHQARDGGLGAPNPPHTTFSGVAAKPPLGGTRGSWL